MNGYPSSIPLGHRPLDNFGGREQHPRRGRYKTRLPAEGRRAVAAKPPHPVARFRDFATMLHISPVDQPVKVPGRQAKSPEAVDFNGILPVIGLDVAGIVLGFGQVQQAGLNPKWSRMSSPCRDVPFDSRDHWTPHVTGDDNRTNGRQKNRADYE